ncbi:NAD(P)/FAD-dependent oxidoreductase [Vagococcus salmoninarum]|uniref:NAD(P)/FAD-dependent oxidoreductase n=1 Tax=Vagococcus salmoninarum TaxID=2739 RepID=UPI0028D0CBF4|nr:FAD-dependent oxidoreductase [Vagococcus salmoninarum]
MKVAVIGGGIVGATTAYYLQNDQKDDVTIFDEKTGQATSAAAGIISPWLSQRRNQNWYQLARLGAKFYPEMIESLNVPQQSDVYQQVGTILFKNSERLLDKLFTIATERKLTAPEIGEIAILTPAEIQAKIPILQPELAGLFVSGGARVDGRQLIETLLTNFKDAGGTYCPEKVTSIKMKGDQWEVSWNGSSETFDKVVLAVGAWLPNLLKPLGFEVDVRGQKGQLIELQLPIETKDWPVIMPQGESDIIPFSQGKILVGATHENDLDYDLTVDQKVVAEMLESLSSLAPNLLKATQVETRVGTRAYTSDFLPFFGEVQDLPSLFVASGLGSSGLTTGPIIGKTLASWIHNEDTELIASNYSPNTYIQKIN